MIELIMGCMSGAALAFGLCAYIFGEKDRKRISELEKKLQAIAHDDNLLENDIKELKSKITFLVSTNDVRLINNHINRLETRITRLAEIIHGKRKVK